MEVDKIIKKVPAQPRPAETNETKEFSWEALEYERNPKEKSWFLIPAIIAIGLGLFGVFTDNYLFTILVILCFFTFYVYANKPPRMIKFKIDVKGIEIDNRQHDYSSLRSFWIFYDPPVEKIISLRSKKTFFPYLRLNLADENPAEIRKFLLKFLPERKHRESIIDIWMRRIGF